MSRWITRALVGVMLVASVACGSSKAAPGTGQTNNKKGQGDSPIAPGPSPQNTVTNNAPRTPGAGGGNGADTNGGSSTP
ncbi:MAG: hypothetical protein JOZ37_12880 [Actinobacteria bacterium]|nr:hypothetical protein [Actinomycetota bacterium]MBV9664855.1 hypothetical protein [Actinomycetota bacterium]MBV9935573.1 hypothetical protein [Actinomycetota bacterium]